MNSIFDTPSHANVMGDNFGSVLKQKETISYQDLDTYQLYKFWQMANPILLSV